MPPKKQAPQTSKKTEQKKKEKIIEVRKLFKHIFSMNDLKRVEHNLLI